MFWKQLKRYYKSKGTLITIGVLAIWTGINYYLLHLDRMGWVHAATFHEYGSGINLRQEMADNYQNGIYWFHQLTLTVQVQWAGLFWYFAMACFGIMLSPQLYMNVQDNYGSMILSRISYRKYLLSTLTAQAFYIASLLLLFFVGVLALSMIIIGGGFTLPTSSLSGYSHAQSVPQYLISMFLPLLLGTLITISTILVTSVSCFIIKNKYLLAFIPFLLQPTLLFIGFYIGNLGFTGSSIAGLLSVDNSVITFSSFINGGMGGSMMELPVWSFFIFPLLMIPVFVIFYLLNIRKYERTYLS